MEMKIVIQVFYRPDPHTMPDGFTRAQVAAGLYIDNNGELTLDVEEAMHFESYMDAGIYVEGIEALSMADIPDSCMEISRIILENIA